MEGSYSAWANPDLAGASVHSCRVPQPLRCGSGSLTCERHPTYDAGHGCSPASAEAEDTTSQTAHYCCVQGPTLTMRVHEYALIKIVMVTLLRPQQPTSV